MPNKNIGVNAVPIFTVLAVSGALQVARSAAGVTPVGKGGNIVDFVLYVKQEEHG